MTPQKLDPDAELRETIGLLAEVLAKVSNHVDAQGKALEYLLDAQPSPKLMADASEKAVKASLEPLMHRLLDALSNFTGDKAKLRQRLRDMHQEDRALSRWRPYLPLAAWVGIGLVAAPPDLRRAPLPDKERYRMLGHGWHVA